MHLKTAQKYLWLVKYIPIASDDAFLIKIQFNFDWLYLLGNKLNKPHINAENEFQLSIVFRFVL